MTDTSRAQAPVDVSRAFSFVFEDPGWVRKMLLAGLFGLLSVVIVGLFFSAGYFVRLIRRVAAAEPSPLPEWDDLAGIFRDGLPLVGTYFAYTFGLVVVMGLGMGLAFGVTALGAVLSQGSEALGAVVGALGVLAMVLVYGLFLLLSLSIALLLPAVALRVSLTGRIADAFALGEILAFARRNLGNYAVTLLVYLGANMLSQFGVLLCCVGLFPAVAWSYCVLAFGLGETARADATWSLSSRTE